MLLFRHQRQLEVHTHVNSKTMDTVEKKLHEQAIYYIESYIFSCIFAIIVKAPTTIICSLCFALFSTHLSVLEYTFVCMGMLTTFIWLLLALHI